MWDDGTRWCIKKRPMGACWSHPWVITYPIPELISFDIADLEFELRAAWVRRIDYGMRPGCLPGEAGRFRTFEDARAAFTAHIERAGT